MKSTAWLLIIGFFALLAGDARAQQASIPLSVEAGSDQLRRTPALVVHEVVATSSTVKPAGTEANKPEPAPAKKTSSKSVAVATATMIQIPKPLVLPAGSTPIVGEMGTTGNPKYDEFVAQSAARNGVDPDLILAVMRQESGFNQRARSYKGATGLMQLMPATAWRFGVTNINDPAQNIEGGAKYLRFLLDSFNGDVNLTLAGYNAGENAVVNSGYRIPRYRETQNYVRSITARYDASKSKPKSVAATASAAPAATVFAGGASGGRLSNNY
jgi:soluble lytic murein transglycosylase-like protein